MVKDRQTDIYDARMIYSKIYMYWHQGFARAPEVVQKCVESWRYHNPDREVILLSKQNLDQYVILSDYIPNGDLKKIKGITALSDVIRILLLKELGGIWIDSTVLCLKPLSQWIKPHIQSCSFFGFSNPGKDRMISSWFLMAPKDDYIIDSWVEEVQRYWGSFHFFHKYYWFHNLFKKRYRSDSRFREYWDQALKFSADGPHHFAPFREKFFAPASQDRISSFETADLPLVKLTYKCIKDGYPEDSMIDYLLNRRPL